MLRGIKNDWAILDGEMYARCPVFRELGNVGRRWRWDSGWSCCRRPLSQDVLTGLEILKLPEVMAVDAEEF